jgi:crotonobetainyl-CoA:carnitine CoA-transferase CaiB-like acyl-CoA transferase
VKKDATLPLDGIRVIDLTTYAAAPACAVVLADWGADVIKVESTAGDIFRFFGYIMQCPVADDDNIVFECDNRNKRGISVDLKTAEGKEIIDRLLGTGDVLVTNFRPKALAKLGLDYESISRKYPRIVYAYLNGYGDEGPDKDKPGFDLAAFFARSGINVEFGEPGTEPLPSVGGFGDHITGTFLAGGIAGALYSREKTGTGCKVQSSLLNAAIWSLSVLIASANNNGKWLKQSRKKPRTGLMNTYKTKDDRWITIMVLEYDRYWKPFCEKVIKMPELINDERFVTQAAVFNNSEAQAAIIEKELLKYTGDELTALLKEADIVYETNPRWHELKDDPQVRETGFMTEYTLPNGRKDWIANSPVRFNGERPFLRRRAPRIGEHNAEILREIGYDDRDIEALRNKKVIT